MARDVDTIPQPYSKTSIPLMSSFRNPVRFVVKSYEATKFLAVPDSVVLFNDHAFNGQRQRQECLPDSVVSCEKDVSRLPFGFKIRNNVQVVKRIKIFLIKVSKTVENSFRRNREVLVHVENLYRL